MRLTGWAAIAGCREAGYPSRGLVETWSAAGLIILGRAGGRPTVDSAALAAAARAWAKGAEVATDRGFGGRTSGRMRRALIIAGVCALSPASSRPARRARAALAAEYAARQLDLFAAGGVTA